MKNKQGSATLITLLVFMIIALSISATSVAILISNSQSGSMIEQGTNAYSAAESGVENAIIQLLRNRSYIGETLTVGNETAEVIVSGAGPYTIISLGKSGAYSRTIQVILNDTSGVLTISSWKEIYP